MTKIRKLIVVGAMALMMMVLAAPAMAQVVGYCDEYGVCTYWNPDTGTGDYYYWPVDDECGYFWDPSEEVWYWACWED